MKILILLPVLGIMVNVFAIPTEIQNAENDLKTFEEANANQGKTGYVTDISFFVGCLDKYISYFKDVFALDKYLE